MNMQNDELLIDENANNEFDEIQRDNAITDIENHTFQAADENSTWYALKTFEGQEKSAANKFINKLRNLNLIDRLVEIFTPKQNIVVLKRNKKVIEQKNFYPGYVFVCLNTQNSTLLADLSYQLFRKHNKPQLFTSTEIEQMKALVKEFNDKPKTSLNVEVGSRVKIIEGPYVDMKGIVDKIDAHSGKIIVKLDIFGGSTPAELNINQVLSDE